METTVQSKKLTPGKVIVDIVLFLLAVFFIFRMGRSVGSISSMRLYRLPILMIW